MAAGRIGSSSEDRIVLNQVRALGSTDLKNLMQERLREVGQFSISVQNSHKRFGTRGTMACRRITISPAFGNSVVNIIAGIVTGFVSEENEHKTAISRAALKEQSEGLILRDDSSNLTEFKKALCQNVAIHIDIANSTLCQLDQVFAVSFDYHWTSYVQYGFQIPGRMIRSTAITATNFFKVVGENTFISWIEKIASLFACSAKKDS